ncbi:MAG TPA: LacI family DNA-binding transcriptional regulator, partial [Pseudolabrys sp.]|nr:LacI family DNA-binding transcriptional regulator [Pseudolabrys sp.]
ERVSAEIVARVSSAAKELGYRPNRVARALRMDRSSSVGLLIPDISNPAYPPMVRGLEDVLRPSGISLLLASTDNYPQREVELVSAMLDQRVDGLFLATATSKYSPLRMLLAAKIPIVLLNRSMDDLAVPLVRGDDHKGIRLAVQHLAELGHRRIAHLAGTDAVSNGFDRREAFIAAMKESGLDFDPAAVVSADRFKGPVGTELGAAMAGDLLSRKVPFTALIAANDLLAIGCYDVFKSKHIRIPKDVSIVGYNDVAMVDRLSPPLTTVRHPLYEIGVRAARLMIERFAGAENEAMTIGLAATLIVRKSTAPPPPRAVTV